MSNKDAPGVAPYCSGGNSNPRIEYLDLADANTAFGIGAPLAIVSGQVNLWSSGPMCGFAAEAKAANAGGSGVKVAVYNDPETRFVAQTDNGTGTLTAEAGIGLNATLLPGSVSNGRQTTEIDESSGDVVATLPVKILFLEPAVDNAYGEFNRLVFKINNHQLATGTGTLGS